jgi:petrobactin synthase
MTATLSTAPVSYGEIVDAICRTLREMPDLPDDVPLRPETRLQEDLGMDSVSALSLIVMLEIECGIAVPETAVFKEAFATISSLARALTGEAAAKSNEEFEDIKVHCFISCLCEIVKACDFTDHRPFYFGVWDAEIVVDQHRRITNHSETLRHDFFRDWFQRLYGVEIVPWFDPKKSRQENLDLLSSLLETKSPRQQLMVMLDLHQLPERENRFDKDPFPHYVLLEKTDDPETLFMSDPDFRWEGTLPARRVFQAIDQPTVSGGFLFDAAELTPTSPESIDAYFRACLIENHNPLTDAIRAAVEEHAAGLTPDGLPLALEHLEKSVSDVPLLAIRKYAYEHGLAFFWRDLSLDGDEFEHWCDVIADLVHGYTRIHYRAIKLSNVRDEENLREIFELLDEQDEREFRIKRRLQEVHLQWAAARFEKPETTADS